MKKGIWNDEEVVSLFRGVESYKQGGQSIKEAFISHAEKYGRKPNSVRNYYYHEIDNLKKDAKRAARLKIDLDSHQKSVINYFSPQEEEKVMKQIDKLVGEGCSVRKACLTLSNGDVSTMLRYQNKYRTYLAGKQKQSNIIKFAQRKKEVLTEADIQSLFMGLVRLVKRSAIDELSSKMKQEREASNFLLRKTLVDLNKKDREIKALKEEFIHIKSENARLVQSMIELKCDKASKLSKHLKEKNAF